MEKFVTQALLYDFYGELLTEHQKRIYELVVLEDYSYSEIAKDVMPYLKAMKKSYSLLQSF